MRRRLLYVGEPPVIEGLPMDVVLWNRDNRLRYFVNKDEWSLNAYPSDVYVPIGVVVIPLGHNRYEDGSKSIGVISLRYASYEQPKLGTPMAYQLYWGDYNGDYDYYHGFRNSDNQCVIPYNVSGTTINEEYISFREGESINTAIVYAPSDDYNKLSNTLDAGTYYSVETMDSGGPSPYVTGDGASSLYGQKEWIYGDLLAFGRFDGETISIGYLEKLYDTKSYIDWLHEGPVELNYTSLALPAMEACWRYAPEGTHEGGWYLPSAGEYGYIIARKRLINETIAKLAVAYDGDYAQITESGSTGTTTIPYTLTSSECLDGSYMTKCVGYSAGEGWLPVYNNVNGIARPFKRIQNVSDYGPVGIEPIPNNNTQYAGRYGIYREADTDGAAGWPSGVLSGDVYALRIADQYDYTVVQTDIKLFTINSLYSDDYVEASSDNLQFGYFGDNVEPGYYVIHYIERTNGERVYNLRQNTYSIGDILSDGTDGSTTDWNGIVTVCSNYMNLDGLAKFTEDGGNGDYFGFNDYLYPIHIGYFKQDVAIWLTPTSYTPGPEIVIIPREGDEFSSMEPSTSGAYNTGRFSTGSHVWTATTGGTDIHTYSNEVVFYTSHLISVAVGSTITIDADNAGKMGTQEPNFGKGDSAFSFELRFRNSSDGVSHTLKSWSIGAEAAGLLYQDIGSSTITLTNSDIGSSAATGYLELVKTNLKVYGGSIPWAGLCSPFIIEFAY